MELTQPTVARYLELLEESRGGRYDTEEIRSAAGKLAEGLASRQLNLSDATLAVCQLCARLKSGGCVCLHHKEQIPQLNREGCQACVHLFGRRLEPVDSRGAVLQDLRNAIALLERSDAFPGVMPEVLVNVVEALPGATELSEIAGVPGRILKVRGRARCFTEPEFGASSHMASILRAAIAHDPKVRAAIDIGFTPRVRKVLEKHRWSQLVVDRRKLPGEIASDENGAVIGLSRALGRGRKAPEVLIDLGGVGIEPVAYLFGPSAPAVAERAVKIAAEAGVGG